MDSMSCRSTFANISAASDGSVIVAEAADASAAEAERVRALTEAGSDAIERLNVGSIGEGEWKAYG
eukprot:1314591-Pleurochrysis_carterae.AAC.1